ncbi:MAG: hypothetical protein SCL54_09070 [Bacillota bacterium]|nr:hypothetical protein [Bacillota bacterium]
MKLSERTDLPPDLQNLIKDLEELQNDPTKEMEALSKEIFVLDLVQIHDEIKERGLEKYLEYYSGEELEYLKKKFFEINFELGKRSAALEIAKNMKLIGIEPSLIQSTTGLDIEVINSI